MTTIIFIKKHSKTEECIKNYVLNSNAIRLACEVCEHYIKAMLIDKGQTWNEMRALGHNLLFLMESMDKENRDQIVSNLLPLYTDLINLTKEEKEILKCMMTHKPNKNIVGVTVKAEKYYIDKNLEKQEQNQIKKYLKHSYLMT